MEDNEPIDPQVNGTPGLEQEGTAKPADKPNVGLQVILFIRGIPIETIAEQTGDSIEIVRRRARNENWDQLITEAGIRSKTRALAKYSNPLAEAEKVRNTLIDRIIRWQKILETEMVNLEVSGVIEEVSSEQGVPMSARDLLLMRKTRLQTIAVCTKAERMLSELYMRLAALWADRDEIPVSADNLKEKLMLVMPTLIALPRSKREGMVREIEAALHGQLQLINPQLIEEAEIINEQPVPPPDSNNPVG